MSAAPAYEFQGRTVSLPCVVRDASSGSATFGRVAAKPATSAFPSPKSIGITSDSSGG